MHQTSRRDLLGLTAAIPFAGKAFKPRAFRAPTGELSPREEIRDRYFPNFALKTHEGKTVHFYDDLVKNKIVTINFFYAKCDKICPLVMANLVKVHKLLGKMMGSQIFMNSITLQPKVDTVDALKSYAEMMGVGQGWTLLTGEPTEIDVLRRSLGFSYPNPVQDKDITNHIGNIRYGNEPLMLWAACPGMAHPLWIAKTVLWVDRSMAHPPEWAKES